MVIAHGLLTVITSDLNVHKCNGMWEEAVSGCFGAQCCVAPTRREKLYECEYEATESLGIIQPLKVVALFVL